MGGVCKTRVARSKLYFLTVYAKNVQTDLPRDELREWRDLIRSIKTARG